MADQKLTSKTAMSTIVDADLFHTVDVSDTTSDPLGTSKKTLWSLIKSTLKTYFDTIYVLVANFLEQNLIGTAVEDATLTGAESIDLSIGSDAYYTLAGNTTISVTNLPGVNTSFVRSWTVKSAGTESLTLPVTWVLIGTYDATGVANYLNIRFSNFTSAGASVICWINQA